MEQHADTAMHAHGDSPVCDSCRAGLRRLQADVPRSGDYGRYRWIGATWSVASFDGHLWRDTVSRLVLSDRDHETLFIWVWGDQWRILPGHSRSTLDQWLRTDPEDRAYIPGERAFLVRKAVSELIGDEET